MLNISISVEKDNKGKFQIVKMKGMKHCKVNIVIHGDIIIAKGIGRFAANHNSSDSGLGKSSILAQFSQPFKHLTYTVEEHCLMTQIHAQSVSIARGDAI